MQTKFYIEDDGDEDAHLWVVLNERGECFYSTRDKNKARQFVDSYNNKELTPTSPNWENSPIAKLSQPTIEETIWKKPVQIADGGARATNQIKHIMDKTAGTVRALNFVT